MHKDADFLYLLNKSKIEDLLATYCRTVDEAVRSYPLSQKHLRDFSKWGEVFTDIAYADYSDVLGGTGVEATKEEIAEMIKTAESNYVRTRHNLTSVLVEEFNEDFTEAKGSAYMEAVHLFNARIPEATRPHISYDEYTVTEEWTLMAVYDFKFKKTAKGWKIAYLKLNLIHYRGNLYGLDLLVRAFAEPATTPATALN